MRAFWDREAGVWVADSQDIPGLITEAESLNRLRRKLDAMIPELLRDNCGCSRRPMPFDIAIA
ncbi:MAG TPA: DUF1902 domain-containing protein [Terriglobales bacterium]|nr:DUF1902 domain-containing protein [Terriglobales bacterium]